MVKQNINFFAMLVIGITESSGWFMKPAAVHDYQFQNANTLFGRVRANIEYFWLMVLKIREYLLESPNEDNFLKVWFNIFMGYIVAITHFCILMLFGWIV